MALDDRKIVQGLIQGLIQVAEKVESADDLAQDLKAKYQTLNPSLNDSNLTAGQVTAITTFIASLKTLREDVVVTTVKSKDHPSHGIKSLG